MESEEDILARCIEFVAGDIHDNFLWAQNNPSLYLNSAIEFNKKLKELGYKLERS